MLPLEGLQRLEKSIREQTQRSQALLDDLCADARSLRANVRPIRPRAVTTVAVVASDGGDNRLVFDPFCVQVVRVVDSYGKELLLDSVTPTTDPDELVRRHLAPDGTPRSALGRMMADLGVRTLHQLSPMIPDSRLVREEPERVKPGWVQVYRDLCEWAVLYERIRYQTFATDTLLVRDGLLRSKIFSGTLFMRLMELVKAAMERVWQEDRRRIYLVGIAKRSKVLERYSLALALEQVFPPGEARYVRVPRDIERKAYRWLEWARGTEEAEGEGEEPKFVAGEMYLVRFGAREADPVWPVDLLPSQAGHADAVFGYLLEDARAGFPIPYYPLCLQRAHEHAQITGFGWVVLQDLVLDAIRDLLPADRRHLLDAHRLRPDWTRERYE
jgi:hypothetical protein